MFSLNFMKLLWVAYQKSGLFRVFYKRAVNLKVAWVCNWPSRLRIRTNHGLQEKREIFRQIQYLKSIFLKERKCGIYVTQEHQLENKAILLIKKSYNYFKLSNYGLKILRIKNIQLLACWYFFFIPCRISFFQNPLIYWCQA